MFMQLYEALAIHVSTWRAENYKHEDYPAVAEILEWASNPDVPNFRLRKPQLRALETYWYLRLRENTPHIFELYQSLFPKKKDLLEAFGIPEEAFSRADYDLNTLVQAIRTDAGFVKEFRLNALRESYGDGEPPPNPIITICSGRGWKRRKPIISRVYSRSSA